MLWLFACALALFQLVGLPLRDFDEATVARVALENADHRLWRIQHLLDNIELHSASMESYASIFSIINSAHNGVTSCDGNKFELSMMNCEALTSVVAQLHAPR